jgi:hypothetical protein
MTGCPNERVTEIIFHKSGSTISQMSSGSTSDKSLLLGKVIEIKYGTMDEVSGFGIFFLPQMANLKRRRRRGHWEIYINT